MYTIRLGFGLSDKHGRPLNSGIINEAHEFLGGLLSELFYGCTVVSTEGYWQGQGERSLIFEALTDAFDEEVQYPLLLEGAGQVARLANQDAVMVAVFETAGHVAMVGPSMQTPLPAEARIAAALAAA
jgi:hypothetical protein